MGNRESANETGTNQNDEQRAVTESKKMPSKTAEPGCFPFGRKGAKQQSRKITLATLGLDNAGKTSTVLHLAKEPKGEVTPTVGFESKDIKIGPHKVRIYDLGGGERIRGIWKNYLAEIHGIVFVVDAADPQRLEEAAKEFRKLSENEFMAGKPCLILANKSDQPDALSEYELTEAIHLEEIVNRREMPTYVKASTTTAKQCHTLDEGVQWLLLSIVRDYEELNSRVEADMAAEKEKQRKERQARSERVRREREAREAAEGKQEEEEEVDATAGSSNPFQPLNKKDLEKKEKAEKAARAAAKLANKERSSSSPPPENVQTDRSETSADEGGVLEKENAMNLHDAGDITSAHNNGITPSFSHPLLSQRKPRVPSPLPGSGENGASAFHHSMGKLPPLELVSNLKPLEPLAAGDVKRKKKKKKNRISPSAAAHTEELVAVAEAEEV